MSFIMLIISYGMLDDIDMSVHIYDTSAASMGIGLQKDDVIYKLNDTHINNYQEFKENFYKLYKQGPIFIQIKRANKYEVLECDHCLGNLNVQDNVSELLWNKGFISYHWVYNF